jgi:hypothetical protein
MFRFAVMFVMIVAFGACNQPEEQPQVLLPEEQMVQVLVELHLAEARVELIQIPQDSIRPLLKQRYSDIFTQLEIDTTAFNTTFEYYEQHPTEMDLLYEKVIDNLVEREATYRTNTPDSTEVSVPTPVDSIP